MWLWKMYRRCGKREDTGLITNPNLLGLSPAPFIPNSLLHPLSGNISPPCRCSGWLLSCGMDEAGSASCPCTSHSLLRQFPRAGSYLRPQAAKLFGSSEDEALAQSCLAQPQGHKSFTLQAEGLQPEFCAVEHHEAVGVLWSETRILLVPVKVTRVPAWANLFDFTNIH